MSAEQTDVVLEQGSTFAYVWQILSKDLTTGYTWAGTIRTQHAGGIIVSMSSAAGTLVVTKSGSHTHVTANLSSAATAAYAAPAMHVYDLEYTHTASGVVTRAVEGSIFVTPEATR